MLVQTSPTSRPMMAGLCCLLVAALALFYCLHPVDQLFERAIKQDAIELRPVVVDETDIFDDNVVDLPFIACHVELIVNRDRLRVSRNDLALHDRIGAVASLVCENNLL